jgi:hypothetical protein
MTTLISIGEELSEITSQVELAVLAVLGLGNNYDCNPMRELSRAS